MKKKIAVFHELPLGGARRGANEFAKALSKYYRVELYYIDEVENNSERGYYDRINYYHFKSLQWNGGNWKVKLYKDTIELYRLYQLHKKIARKINTVNYEFVFIHGSRFTQAPFLIAMVKNKSIYYCQEPLRMTLEDYFAIPKDISFFKKVYEKLNRMMRRCIDMHNMRNAELILANSTFTKQNIHTAYGLVSTVCHMGVDTKIFYPERGQKEYELLFIGSYDFADGYPLLQETLRILAQKKMRVKYITHEDGWIADDVRMRKFYNSAYFTLAFGYKEPFGLIPLESMACGTPVIALHEGGYNDSVVADTTGIFVERKPEEIAQKILYYFHHPKKIALLGVQAEKYISNNWTWEQKIRLFLEIINK